MSHRHCVLSRLWVDRWHGVKVGLQLWDSGLAASGAFDLHALDLTGQARLPTKESWVKVCTLVLA